MVLLRLTEFDKALLAVIVPSVCLCMCVLARDLISWMNERRALVSSLELAKDVGGAEALLARHKEVRVSDSEWKEKEKG